MKEILHIPVFLWIMLLCLVPAWQAKLSKDCADFFGYVGRHHYMRSAWWVVGMFALMLGDAYYMIWSANVGLEASNLFRMSDDTLGKIAAVEAGLFAIMALKVLNDGYQRVQLAEQRERDRLFARQTGRL